MKTKIFALAALVLLLAACTQDELADDNRLPEGEYPVVIRATGLSVEATPQAAPSTRATVDGDWQGVTSVALKRGDAVKEYTVTASTDFKSATLSRENAPYYWTSRDPITVSAWWPFDNADITQMPAVKVAEDQSKLADFQNSDFISAENQTVEFNNPTLEFNHRTARVAIELKPGTGFTSVAGATVSLVSLSADNGNPTAIKTYNASGNTYEALTAPQTVAAGKPFIRVELGSGTFYFRPQTNVVLEAGNRYTYTITVKANGNGIEVTEATSGEWDSKGEELVTSYIIYTAADLKPGDYFYRTTGNEWAVSDGGLRKIYADGTTEWESDKTPDNSKGTCIGIVLKVGRDTEGSWADNCDYKLKGSATSMSEVHGYVLALRDAHDGCLWGSQGTEVSCDRNKTTGFNGYSSTQTIVAFNKDKNWNLSDAFPAAYHAVNYETVCPAPSETSGWFLPSGGQCQYWLNHRDVILRSIQNAGGDGWKDRYWSSSETSHNPASNAYYLYMRYGNVSRGSKNSVSAVRACLAF